jgi:serine/threonine protein kinase
LGGFLHITVAPEHCQIISQGYLQEKGVAHRDIKPENLLLDQFGPFSFLFGSTLSTINDNRQPQTD